jgi:hypothetical protein
MSANTIDQTVDQTMQTSSSTSNEARDPGEVRGEMRVEDILSIHDHNIDVEKVMAEIRMAIERRRAEAEARGLNFEQLATGRYQIPTGNRFPGKLYESLYQASLLRDKSLVSPFITPVPVPLVGRLVQRIRGALHQLVIFYVNMSAERQIAFNIETSRALNRLVDALDKEAASDMAAQALSARVSQLEEKIANLERRLPGRE